MKYIFLFIGLGLLLSGCETNDSKIYLKCVEKNPYVYGDRSYRKRAGRDSRIFYLTVDKKRKYVSTRAEQINKEEYFLLDGYYTEDDKVVSTNKITEPDEDHKNGQFQELRLDKLTGSLTIFGVDGMKKTRYGDYVYIFLCKKAELLVR